MKPEKFRKKPVEIEAVKFSGSSSQVHAIREWMRTGEYLAGGVGTADLVSFPIETLEGDMTVRPGDWIIKGVAGEFYPCKPDIFERTYTRADWRAE